MADASRARPARSSTRYERARTSGGRSPRPRGAAPTPACSTTRRSTLAHLPEHGADQRVEPVLRVHVPRRHGVQPRVAQPHQVPRATTASFDIEGYRHACRVFFMAQEILVDLSSYPTKHIAQELATTTARSASATRTSARCSCCMGIPYDSRRGPRDRRRAHRDHVRPRLRASAPRWRRPRAPFAGFAKNREPMLRVMRMHRDAAYADRPRHVPRATLWRAALRGLGRGGRARRAARLPQRAGHGARADGHDRPPHGLRHHGHRARLRAREVQEARRRRLLQDRQPVGARARSSSLGYSDGRGRRRSSPTSRGTNTLLARAARQPRVRSRSAASPTTDLAKVEAALPGVVRARAARSRRGSSARRPTSASASRKEARSAAASRSSSTSASPKAQIDEAQRRRSSAA